MTLDNYAAPARTRQLRRKCVAFLLEKHALFHRVLWVAWEKSHRHSQEANSLQYRVMLVLYSARLVEVKWSEKDLFLAWRVRHSAGSQCREDPPSLVFKPLATPATPTSTEHQQHLTSSYSSAHTITKLGDQHVRFTGGGQESS